MVLLWHHCSKQSRNFRIKSGNFYRIKQLKLFIMKSVPANKKYIILLTLKNNTHILSLIRQKIEERPFYLLAGSLLHSISSSLYYCILYCVGLLFVLKIIEFTNYSFLLVWESILYQCFLMEIFSISVSSCLLKFLGVSVSINVIKFWTW